MRKNKEIAINYIEDKKKFNKRKLQKNSRKMERIFQKIT